ncbi:hypothetical protein B7P43_G16409 [Cryptotermes secundus]|uniref:Uncharacterized protein n=1 Tax=Cryptotermes secundus TaxID=105785 RepID=A0A2J7PV52_9NEOP|nr:hypothetical protein B7P43_G16409 [Cryptotermes secundus]
MNIKAEEVSESQEKADPLQITNQEIKAEPEHCRNSENVLVDTYGETYPTPHNANQAMNVKAEAVSDAEEEEDPLAVTFPELKAEPEAPYSPNMAPCDFWLFPKLKMLLKGTQFESREDIMRNATARLITIPKDAFQKCFQQWRKCWERCVHYQGDYFEGD